MSEPDAMTRLDGFIDDLCRALGVDPSVVDRDAVLDLAGDAAHGVVRPAAPVTTFVAGLVVGAAVAGGEDPAAAWERVLDAVEKALDT